MSAQTFIAASFTKRSLLPSNPGIVRHSTRSVPLFPMTTTFLSAPSKFADLFPKSIQNPRSRGVSVPVFARKPSNGGLFSSSSNSTPDDNIQPASLLKNTILLSPLCSEIHQKNINLNKTGRGGSSSTPFLGVTAAVKSEKGKKKDAAVAFEGTSLQLGMLEGSKQEALANNSTSYGGTKQPNSRMFAAVDMGTNSFHMVVVRADAAGRFEIDDVEKDDVRLGSGSAGFSMITPDAEERALAAIRRFRKIASVRDATMRVVATSAVREARNRRAFVRKVQEATGVDVEVLSGREEACLIYAGVLQALPVFSKTVLTVDIGGGSTEFVLGREGEPLFATSLKLGHIRLTERFVGTEPLNRSNLDEMRRYIRVVLADSGVQEVVRNAVFEVAIGSSGTIETVEQMIHSLGGASSSGGHDKGNGSGGPNGAASEGGASNATSRNFQEKEFTLEDLRALSKRILKAKTPEARAKLPGLPEKRADVIVGGVVLLEEIFLALGIERMCVSPYALREGVIVDTLSREWKSFCPSPNLRRTSVLNLAEKFNIDRRMASALHSSTLALEILAGLQTCRTGGKDCMSEAVQQLGESDAEVLEAATVLHYVGMFISHKSYHKHSHYLIKNNEHLLGFTPMEVEMIALLARYHRKKVPSAKDEELAKLPEDIQRQLKALCAIIRVAVALDRCDSGAVETVTVLQDHDSCVLAVTPAQDPATGRFKDVSLEVWAAQQELDFFEKTFKRRSSIMVADSADDLDEEISPILSS
eukprot:TRINITY_DN3413_c0_g1_i6.p1 TRINITY_DN3413_c0_g1~~TRINITY_DN3413_c0_g1_i6.p1  ORF type:complete len:758 (-),score=121.71 TRINITY_DN3413_c0_g1_i6:752-3025(-)